MKSIDKKNQAKAEIEPVTQVWCRHLHRLSHELTITQNVVFKQGIILYIHYNLYCRIQYNMIFGSYRLYLKSNKNIVLRNVLTVKAVSIRLM